MTTTLTTLFSFGELAMALLLLSILRAGRRVRARQNFGAGRTNAGEFGKVGSDTHGQPATGTSTYNPATDRWEIAMAEFEEQKESYYED